MLQSFVRRLGGRAAAWPADRDGPAAWIAVGPVGNTLFGEMMYVSNLVISVTNFILKWVAATLALWIAERVDPDLYLTFWQVFSTAMAIGIVGTITDLTVLPRMGNGRAVALDFIINVILIWLVPNLFHGAPISMAASLVCSAALSLIEYSTHIFMLKSERLIDRAR